MGCQLLTMLFLASVAQEKAERRQIPAPPARSQIVHVRARIAGKAEVRQITMSMPAPADEDEEPLAPLAIRFNVAEAVVELRPVLCGKPGNLSSSRRHRFDIHAGAAGLPTLFLGRNRDRFG